MRFCPRCGLELQYAPIGGRERPTCGDCGFVHFGDFRLSVGGIVLHEARLLLGRRAFEPSKGWWTLPGGYVEADEDIDEAIVREVLEETGVTTAVRSLVGVRSMPGGATDTYLVFLLDYVGGEPKPDGVESDGAAWFRQGELAAEQMVTPLTRLLATEAFTGLRGIGRQTYERQTGEVVPLWLASAPAEHRVV